MIRAWRVQRQLLLQLDGRKTLTRKMRNQLVFVISVFYVSYLAGIRDAHSLQLCQSLLCASNLSEARQGALLHLDKWCHPSLVFLSLKSRLCFVTLPDVLCILFCFILDSLCDWWGLRNGFCLIENTGTSSSAGKDPDLSPMFSSKHQLVGCHRYASVWFCKQDKDVCSLDFVFFCVIPAAKHTGVLSLDRKCWWLRYTVTETEYCVLSKKN